MVSIWYTVCSPRRKKFLKEKANDQIKVWIHFAKVSIDLRLPGNVGFKRMVYGQADI